MTNPYAKESAPTAVLDEGLGNDVSGPSIPAIFMNPASSRKPMGEGRGYFGHFFDPSSDVPIPFKGWKDDYGNNGDPILVSSDLKDFVILSYRKRTVGTTGTGATEKKNYYGFKTPHKDIIAEGGCSVEDGRGKISPHMQVLLLYVGEGFTGDNIPECLVVLGFSNQANNRAFDNPSATQREQQYFWAEFGPGILQDLEEFAGNQEALARKAPGWENVAFGAGLSRFKGNISFPMDDDGNPVLVPSKRGGVVWYNNMPKIEFGEDAYIGGAVIKAIADYVVENLSDDDGNTWGQQWPQYGAFAKRVQETEVVETEEADLMPF